MWGKFILGASRTPSQYKTVKLYSIKKVLTRSCRVVLRALLLRRWIFGSCGFWNPVSRSCGIATMAMMFWIG
jgi:hypothetical protein